MIAAIVLAAGSARRFGSDKRRHLIDGTPMLSRTLATYRQVLSVVAAVIRSGETDIADLVVAADCRVVEAVDAAEGQSRSLAAGVRALTDPRCSGSPENAAGTPRVDGLLIALADMPFVGAPTLRSIVDAMVEHPDAIVRPRCHGRHGNPVGFPRPLFDDLARVSGDQGARQLVAESDNVLFVDVDDRGVLRDIDRPDQA